MIKFKIFNEDHLEMLRSWLNQEHIKLHWQETNDPQKLKEKFMVELPRRGVSSFVIIRDGVEVGYIQYYDAQKVGGGWWDDELQGTFGIDLMIGRPELTGIGLGSQVIKEFITFLRSKESGAKSVIIDPDPQNKNAIRAFEKAGFVCENEIKTPGGPALLMRMKIN